MRTLAAAALMALSCAGTTDDTADALSTCDADGPTQGFVITNIMLGRAEGSVSPGFDLDRSEAGNNDNAICGIEDFDSPDGEAGVDNGFAPIIPALMLTEARAAEDLLQSTINAGGLLLTIELEDADSLVEDDCTHLKVGQATGAPFVGSNDRILPGQTLTKDPTVAVSQAQNVAIVDGVVEAHDLDITIPLQVLDADIVFDLRQAAVRLRIAEDGSVTGEMSGVVTFEEFMSVVSDNGVADEVADILETLLNISADFEPDARGQCQSISVVFTFEAVPAFFF